MRLEPVPGMRYHWKIQVHSTSADRT